jgi:hypothetical protein
MLFGGMRRGASLVTGEAFSVTNSGDFEGSSSQSLSVTSGSGNVDKWTAAFWHLRESTGFSRMFGGSSAEDFFRYFSNDKAEFKVTGSNYTLLTTATYTDTTNWHHWTVVYDSGNATGGNRMRIYFDGTEVTGFDTDTNPPQNTDATLNDGNTNYIGTHAGGNQHFDGLIAEFYMINDYVGTPSDFIDGTPGNPIEFDASASTDTHLQFKSSGNLGENTGGLGDWTNNAGVVQSASFPP